MLADNLVLCVALELLRTCVPTADVTFGIEHEDGVVANFVDEKTEALLTLAQQFFCAFMLSSAGGEQTGGAVTQIVLLLSHIHVRLAAKWANAQRLPDLWRAPHACAGMLVGRQKVVHTEKPVARREGFFSWFRQPERLFGGIRT